MIALSRCRLSILVTVGVFGWGIANTAQADTITGYDCTGTKFCCNSTTFATSVLGDLVGNFAGSVSASTILIPNSTTVVLQWHDFASAGFIEDEKGDSFPTTVQLNDALSISTATITEPNLNGFPPSTGGPFTPPAEQVNRYFFEFTIETLLGNLVIFNPSAWIMTGEIDGWPPDVFHSVYTQIGSADLYVADVSPQLSGLYGIKPGDFFGEASGAVVQVGCPEPATWLLAATACAIPLVTCRQRRRPSRGM